jgi:hypothetical protein
MVDTCPRCELRFERIEGHLTGALGVNTVLSIVVVVLVGILGFVLTFPESPVVPLTATVGGVAVLFPLLFYPFSKTVWTAVDLRIRPLEPGEVRPGFGDWMRL